MRLQPGDWVYVTNERLSFSNKTFVVLSTNLELVDDDNDVPVTATRLVLQEVESSVFSHAVSDYGTVPAEGTDTSTQLRTISAPSGLTVNQVALEKFALNFAVLTVNWTNSASELVDGTEVTYRVDGSSRYVNLGIVARGVDTVAIPQVEIDVTYEVRVRHKSIYGTFSSYVTATITTSGTVTTETEIANDNITIDATTGNIGGIGTGSGTTVNNQSILIDHQTGKLVGIGTDDIFVNNHKITIDTVGQITGIGTGANTKVGNDQIEIDASTGQLSGIGTGNNTTVANSKVTVDSTTGELTGIGTSSIVVNNSKITVNESGELVGVGTNNIVVNNQLVTVDSDGKLLGIGTANIIVDNDNIASSNLVGTGKVFSTLPANGATVGAQTGTNLFDTDGTTALGANDIKNGNIGIDADGRLTNTGTGTTVVNNNKITVDGTTGELSGIGTSSVVVNNQKITVDGTTGELSGIGTNSIIVNNSKITVDVNGKLAGIGTSDIVVNNDKITVDSDGDLVGIGTDDIRVNNAKITTNTDGSLNYSGTGTGDPTMNTLQDAESVRSRVKAGLGTNGDVARTVGKSVGGWGEDISSKSGIPDFSTGTITYQTTVPKTRGGLEEDLSAKTGVLRVENGTFNFDAQLPANRGGTGLTSITTLANSNVVTFEVEGGALFVWSKFATGNFNPSVTTYTFTVRWRNGAGTLLTTSSIQLNLDTTNTDFDAPTVTAGSGNSFNAITDVSGTGSTEQTISVSRGSVKCTVVGRIEVVTGFTFKFE